MINVFYDGTFEGFLTLLSKYVLEEEALDNIKIKNFRFTQPQGELFYEEVVTNSEKARKFLQYLKKNLPKVFFEKIYTYYLCDHEMIEIPLIKTLKEIKKNPDIFQDFSRDEIIKLHKAEKSFYRERHRWFGFLRFIELPNRILFAKFEPKFNVLPKLWFHFIQRYPNEKLIIFDSLRNLIFLYKDRKKEMMWIDDLEIEIPLETDLFVMLWRNYFFHIALPERKSYERQRNKVPFRTRRFLPEFWNSNFNPSIL
ncbi:MAG: TIGR03915 family putative DNA repair protein [Thermodesulfovibrio sp.]|nr:TIGR03915 family putative DNA repair protein [Thermodesulfovibrio sp.]MDW7999119.1 TIGR03915 family putative DNA repair protein [Thermodesulfovibrio sp.]